MRQNLRSHERVAQLLDQRGPGPWTTTQLRSFGWTIDALQAAVAAGRLVRLRRGVYGRPDDTSAGLMVVRAALESIAGSVVSHESAARIETLWLPMDARGGVHLTCAGSSERTSAGVTVHGSRLPSEFVTEIDGMPITTIPRTSVDVARGRAFPEALVVIDSAVRRLAINAGTSEKKVRESRSRSQLSAPGLDQLAEAFNSIWTWPGSVAVRAAIAAADIASESAHESRSRAWIIEARLPMPLIGFEVYGASGKRYFADFAWPDRMLLGEADGFAKYLASGDDRALREERLRQADLEDAGWRFVRWTTSDRRAAVVRRVSRALAFE